MSYHQPDFFRFGTDSLWLVDVIKANIQEHPDKILELGAGCGVVSCELAQVYPEAKLFCVEVQDAFLTYLAKNLNKNALNRSEVIHSSVKNFNQTSQNKFDLIVFNPPYFERSASRPSPSIEREICRKHIIDEWDDWVNCAQRSLSPNGVIYWVHRSEKKVSNKLRVEKIANFGELGVWSARSLDVE